MKLRHVLMSSDLTLGVLTLSIHKSYTTGEKKTISKVESFITFPISFVIGYEDCVKEVFEDTGIKKTFELSLHLDPSVDFYVPHVEGEEDVIATLSVLLNSYIEEKECNLATKRGEEPAEDFNKGGVVNEQT